MVVDTVAKNLLFSTTCIEGSNGSGTGFGLSHSFPDYGKETFLVTNKHVVNGMQHARICFTRRVGEQPVIGHTFAFECEEGFGSVFTGHPDPNVDIAVLPVSFLLRIAENADRKAFLMDLPTDIILCHEGVEKLDVVMPVLFVGYPAGLYDQKHRTPIFRRGTTATPVQLDYGGEPVFLIDASVFPGSSGSPVFTYDAAWNGEITNLRLLGIIAQVLIQHDTGEINIVPAPTQKTATVSIRQMLDLGVVFKAHLIRETILECWNQRGNDLRRLKEMQ